MANPILENILWFPVKGFPAKPLARTALLTGIGIPNDRRYAITRGTVSRGEWMPARSYYINSRVDGMMKFSLDHADESGLQISNPAGQQISLWFEDDESLRHANEKMDNFMQHVGIAEDLPPPSIIERNNRTGNWDYPDTMISIINAETVKEIASAMGQDMEPDRYRGNLVISNLPAWQELDWQGKRIRIGEAELEVMRPIIRCPTPGVNPQTAERDINFASVMPELYGHAYCGMYATVVKDGTIAENDEIKVVGNAEMPLETATAVAEDYRLWTRSARITTCEIGDEATRISLTKTGPWPLPVAVPGQRVRLHLAPGRWTSEYIAATSPDHYHLEVTDSPTDDPVTRHLRHDYKAGESMVISGPFGKA